MVAKSQKQTTKEKEPKQSRVKVGKLKLNKETINDLLAKEQQAVKGGFKGGGGTNTAIGQATCD